MIGKRLTISLILPKYLSVSERFEYRGIASATISIGTQERGIGRFMSTQIIIVHHAKGRSADGTAYAIYLKCALDMMTSFVLAILTHLHFSLLSGSVDSFMDAMPYIPRIRFPLNISYLRWG